MFYLIMRLLRTCIWVILNGFLLVCLWAGFNPLYSQSITDLSLLFRLDSEDSVSEQDIFLLEESLGGRKGITAKTLINLAELSILTDLEVLQLTIYSRKRPPKSILQSPELSWRLKYILLIIEQNNNFPQESIEIRQLTTGRGDLRYLWRSKIKIEKLEMGFLFERDPGEIKIADHGLIFIKGQRGNLNWIAGDHQISAGLGLLAGSSQAPLKGFTSASSMARFGRGFRPFQSTNESWGLRGLALWGTGLKGKWKLSFGKNKYAGRLRSLQNYSHLNSKIPHKNLVELFSTAGWEYEQDLLQAGFLVVSQNLSGNQKESNNFVYSTVYVMLRGKQVKCFAEFAIGRGQGRARILGAAYRVEKFRYLLHFHQYEKNYTGFRSNPAAEWNTSALNEVGVFQSLVLKNANARLTVFGDIFSQAHNRGGKDGYESGFRSEYPVFHNQFLMQWKSSNKFAPGELVYVSENNVSSMQKYSTKFIYTGSFREWRWKIQFNRVIQIVNRSQGKGRGLSIAGTWSRTYFTLSLNWILIKMDTVPARLYFWDINLPGEMRNRSFARSGHSPALIFRTRRFWGSEIGFRIRAIWQNYSFEQTPGIDSAFFLESRF